MPVRTKTTIFNAALVRTGNSKDQTSSPLWEAMDTNYDEIVRVALEDGDGVYPFGRSRETLTSRSDGTLGYDDAFKMPNSVIHVIEVYLNKCAASDMLVDWEIDGENHTLEISAKNKTVEIEFIKRGLEYTWSGIFAKGIQRRLEAVIKDVEEEVEESAAKDQDADFHFLKGSIKGSKNRSQKPVYKRHGGRLVRARRGSR